ncbi:MAG: response regulator [Deltaproteobacteria bacterium]|nr:response regulator [Deltaproteobacteria bacterium]
MRRKILVVDDEEIIAEMLGEILSDEGAVEYAKDGRAALDKIAGTTYDVFIVDMNMPGMNGMEFYKEAVKTNPAIKERIIFFTGTHEEDYLSFFRENNLRYIAKPSESQDLRNQVREILDHNSGEI